jgi:hypothetical protein
MIFRQYESDDDLDEDETCMDDMPLMYSNEVSFKMDESDSLVNKRRRGFNQSKLGYYINEGLAGTCGR